MNKKEVTSIEEKKKKIIDYFLENPTATIIDISNATGISKSSVQRYLNDPIYMNILIPKTGKTVAEQLKLNKIVGNQKGGRTTFLTHSVQQDAAGKFIGTSRDTTEENKEERKREDIIKFARYFSQNPYVTLEEMAEYFDKIYTKSYIYDCLNDPRVEELFGKLIADALHRQLEQNKYNIRRKFEDNWGQQLFEEAGLTEREIEVLNLRFSGDIIRSAEDVGRELNVSKTLITRIEDQALEKLKAYKRDEKKI